MGEIFRRFVWITLITSAIAYVTYLCVGGVVNAQAQDSGPVTIRDELSPGSHRLYGMVMVPLSCQQLTVTTQALSPSTYALVFSTWEDPAIVCKEDAVPRAFHAQLFAPSTGINFIATLDNESLPIVVLPDISH